MKDHLSQRIQDRNTNPMNMSIEKKYFNMPDKVFNSQATRMSVKQICLEKMGGKVFKYESQPASPGTQLLSSKQIYNQMEQQRSSQKNNYLAKLMKQ